ncbi:RNA helicase [Anaeromicrobium sediminis]|uniref:RNA helicase n=2 Tax=Anaeromicrobium sediminis TaxID=1478221 RepID=A0A267MHR0_9FIRM|nr:RNA helicase [Anaeromicrobium sediminis]
MNNIGFNKYGINKEIIRALNVLGYEKPMEVQSKVIPLVLEGKDLIVKSQTGSGKTGAFAIPLCEKIELETNKPQALVLTPTRELAVQVSDEITNIGKFKKIRSVKVYGKQPIQMQIRQLKQRVHVVVGTPGRISDHIKRKTIKLEDLKYLVIDEADELLNRGFIDQVEDIIKKLPHDRKTLLFSATMPEKIREICSKYMISPEQIQIESKNPTTKKIKQAFYEVEERDKVSLLKNIINEEEPESCIIFCNTRQGVEKLTNKLKRQGYYCEALHGGMHQNIRLRTISKFKMGQFNFLVATDLAGRGIHVDSLSLVINYNVPFENEAYVHRIGRTGRVEEKGIAISLVSSNEEERFNELKEYLNYEIPKGKMNNKKPKVMNEKLKKKPKIQRDVAENFNKDITRIRINVGSKKKIRSGDILGALTNIKGVSGEDIGIIDIQDTCSYIEIFNKKGDMIWKALQNNKIKGKNISAKKIRIRRSTNRF